MAKDRPGKKKNSPPSMSMIEPRIRNIYLSFYKESYFTPSALDLKTKELIAIGCFVPLRLGVTGMKIAPNR